MSRFFVGQRVRLVRSLVPANNGATGRIAAVGFWRYGDLLPSGNLFCGGHADCLVDWDAPVTDTGGRSHKAGATVADRLEPILPEGSAPSEFTTLRDLLNSLEGVAA